MITDSTASIIMSSIQERLKDKLERESYIFPSLILMNEESHIRIDDLMGSFPCLLNAEYLAFNNINVTVVAMRNRDESDDQNILDFIQEVTLRYAADATGYIAQVLYKPSMKKEEYDTITIDEMNKDPDTFRVLHNCFFVKSGSEKGFLMITPYVIKESSSSSEEDFVLEDSPQNSVITCGKEWQSPEFGLETRIENPYL